MTNRAAESSGSRLTAWATSREEGERRGRRGGKKRKKTLLGEKERGFLINYGLDKTKCEFSAQILSSTKRRTDKQI